MSTLDSILAQLTDQSVTTKTASVSTPAATPTAEDAALSAVRNATKTASAPAPVAQPTDTVAALQKIAADTAAREQELMVKQAHDQGAAFCDGFMARLAGYDQAFGKTAAVQQGASQEDLQKIAQAAYAQGAADFEKQAAESYQAGYDATLREVHKVASDLHLAGQADARAIVQALAAEKTAMSSENALRLLRAQEVGDAALAAAKSPTGIGALAGMGLGAAGGAAGAGEGNRLQGALAGGAAGGLAGAGLGAYGSGQIAQNIHGLDPRLLGRL